ncbi:uncharacterized protein LOC119446561 isoform X1 [Dermacentor silvarum]|uniref:uncharacterized protein LOC119446561 isoform X1 n=1 Tax=Dermacentor silvarum TaxID=543639 RepID=UPI002101871E|nr:uncharacterized protein LOC119446561 isoform X1 [Dermacentor silvarum]XP_049520172.1 uncharacterized protein LOC119446561 isoform X1 [Dermacentor silvarum]XP_049520173.1 uncharacterized protein LOC119446561 isoform X1 [Dermacentor silvarum]
MGDESMASGMSTGDAGGPPGAAGGVGAEGIMKKLTNYWFIVGSIPLVMFLLVCLPTVFYVKSISEYKNAFYCRSKACDALASATKAAREAKPCDDYFTSVCKAATGFDIAGIFKKEKAFLAKAVSAHGDEGNEFSAVGVFYGKCDGEVAGTDLSYDMIKPVLNGADITLLTEEKYSNENAYEGICAAALTYGIDCLFHFEWMRGATKKAFGDDPKPVLGESLPTPLQHADLSISAPDMGIMEPSHYIVTLGGNKYENILTLVWKRLVELMDSVEDDDNVAQKRIEAIGKKMYELLEYSKDLDYTAAPRMTLLSELGEVKAEEPFTPDVKVSFPELVKKIVPGVDQYERILVRSPNYIDLLTRALNLKHSDANSEPYITQYQLSAFVHLDTILRVAAFFVIPKDGIDAQVRTLWCTRYLDWLSPTTMASLADKYLKTTYWPFGLKNPKDPKGQFPAFTLGMKYMSSLTDAFMHSYALSAASSEKSRAGLYVKMLQMEYMAFYPNKSDAMDTEQIKQWNPQKFGEDFSLQPFLENRKALMSIYWNKPTTDLKFAYIIRSPLMFSDDVGSYDYGTNLMFVPFGMFRPSFYRDSTAYMGNYATFGYYGSMNLMKMIDNAGSYAKAGYNYPIMWPGTYAVGRMNSHYRCFNPEKLNETNARLVAKGSNPISPGFRYFRRHALARAHPRPEYRLDLDARADMEQIYLTAVMRTYCRYKTMKESVNKMFQHNLYFQSTYCSEGGKLKIGADKMCYIWHSTRRNY